MRDDAACLSKKQPECLRLKALADSITLEEQMQAAVLM
jgi:hypothetical protein